MNEKDKDKKTAAEPVDAAADSPVSPTTEAADAAAEEAAASSAVDPVAALAAAQQEVEEVKKQLLYKAAEFENFRKRTIAEKTDLILNGGQNVVRALLPVLDDMERALATSSAGDEHPAVDEGWALIVKKLHKVLEGLGVSPIATADAVFTTDYHEAVAQVPVSDDDKKGKVIDCLQTGYMMNGKVLRHAKVAVGV